jgi:ATP-binding cassette subfamily B protein
MADPFPAAKSTIGLAAEFRLVLAQARKVWKLVPHRHKAALGAAAFVMAVTSACNTALALLLGWMVDRVQAGMKTGLGPVDLYRIAGFYLSCIAGAYVLREALLVGRRWLVENACTRLEKTMTLKVISHLLKADVGTLSQEKIGALQGRIGRSVVGFVRFLRLGFLDFFPPLATGLFALLAGLAKQPWLALTMAGVIPISLILTIQQIASQKGVRLKLLRSRENMEGTIVEQLGGLDYIRAAHTEFHEIRRVEEAAEKRRIREAKHHWQMSFFGCAKAINEGFFHILVLALAIYLAVNGQISIGDILTFSILFLGVMAPLNEVHRGLDEGHECSLQVADLLAILAQPPDRSFSPDHVERPHLELGKPAIVAERLYVEYPILSGANVAGPQAFRRALDELSLKIAHGETVGMVGRSGCGKTTLLRVLMRLTHPTSGNVWLGGVPIEAVSREAIGRLIGYVGQSPFVFSGSIAENIAYGTPTALHGDIILAAERACLHHEIMAMPGGYATMVTERGQNLSGGQRQRLALARVFLKNPAILILDEATSALDTISERSVQHAIDQARADRTVLLVAHRLSTLVDADRILVFEAGRIVESGTYNELLVHGGVFSELATCSESEQSAPA